MKQFIRNFEKQKVVGLLNISSLSLGIMVSIIVGLWTMNELSFDSFHKNKEKIYRINEEIVLNNIPTKLGSTYRPFGETAKDELPQIEAMSRVCTYWSDIKIDNRSYSSIPIYVADENFFTFFTFPLKEGDPATVLSAPGNVVISESAATRYFPGENPIGQSIRVKGPGAENDLTITGIMKDMPENSSLHSDFVLAPFGVFLNHIWGDTDAYITFFQLSANADKQAIEESLTQILCRNIDSFRHLEVKITLEPLQKIHFGTGFMTENIRKGNLSLIRIFALVAFVILIISSINFTNLFISTSFIRAKTIGIKKSQGANKSVLVRSFYVETAYYSLIAIGVGMFLVLFLLPLFNDFTQSTLSIDFTSPKLYLFLTVLFAVTVLLSGTFPALYITRFNPIETLKGKFKGKRLSIFQKSLIIFQFSASIALLIVVGFMQRQVDMMIHYDLGFNTENIIHLYGHDHFGKNFKTFRDEMLKETSIVDVTQKNCLPTQWNQGWTIRIAGQTEEVLMEINHIQPNYFDFMSMKIIEGENPFFLESNDSLRPIVINESAVKLLFKQASPLNQIITNQGYSRMIVKGVVKNAHVRSLKDEIDPQIYMKFDWEENWLPVFFKVIGNPQRAIDFIRAKWEESEPNYPFEYHFLDDTYKNLYDSEMKSQKVFTFAMLIAFIISMAGLFAMAFYTTQRRVKEIALRKVNGATLRDLLFLLNKDFVLWVLISFLIASPVAYLSLQSWLEEFTVKTALSIWLFLSVGIIALLVALLTTSFQTWKVATTNPVKMLKDE
ncbi:MAG: ABC transporter permease [Dysgonamonadaceae bacterium]|jgi:putative ABC transport system permease protein|nr:ABC transporter permease [Dysgonamonadaceae bacterium]